MVEAEKERAIQLAELVAKLEALSASIVATVRWAFLEGGTFISLRRPRMARMASIISLELEDKWILSKLNRAVAEITENMDRYELGVAAQKIYDFIWDDYCDWYIELTKTRLQGEDEVHHQEAAGVPDFIGKIAHGLAPLGEKAHVVAGGVATRVTSSCSRTGRWPASP